jgi:two-component system, OmpR family, response regulator MprA
VDPRQGETGHAAGGDLGARRVLVVDDEPAVRESLANSLVFEGYEVVAVSDGVEALDRLKNDRPDLVVLDVLMPRLDGLTACRRLRAGGDITPVLMLAARRRQGAPAQAATATAMAAARRGGRAGPQRSARR